MKNLDRYTLTALWLADFLTDEIRKIILNTSKCTSLTEADARLDEFVAACKTASHNVLCTNPAAMAKISDDARMFGFAESELSRRLNIKDRDHTDKITVITWSYDDMSLFMLSGIDPAEKKLQGKLTGKLYEKIAVGFRTLVSSLIGKGCYAAIGNKVHRYQFFAASAGQMRKQRFVLLRDDMYKKHKEALTLGLTEEKINASGGILASKFLPYLSLCLSSGKKADWFDPDKMIIIPDKSIDLTAVVDTITPEYDVVREERSDIHNPINDGIGFYWRHEPHWKPCNIQIRYPYCKGLLTPLNVVSLYQIYGKEPVVTDIYGTSHYIIREGINVFLTESQMKMAGYFSSIEEFREACKLYNREFVILNHDGGYTDTAELPYQTMQSLTDATDDDLTKIAAKSIYNMKELLTPAGALRALGSDRKTQSGFQKALSLLPELLGDAYTQEAVAALYDQKYRIANSGKLDTDGKYHYIVPDPFALFEALFLGLKPVGSLRAGEVYVKGIEGGKKVDVLRSPHMHTSEHAIETVAKYRKAFEFMDTKAVYINVHDLLFRRLQCDFDGDIALVDDNPVLVDTAERCSEGLVPLYYDAQKGKKKPLNTDAIIEAIFNAADYNRIGIYSIYAVKLLASENPDMTILAKLAAAGNYAIDAAKTGAFIELPKDIEKALRKLDKPCWWKYDHQTEAHPYTDEEYWAEELTQPGNGVIDRIGRIVRNSVPAKAELNVPADNNLWAKMVINPCRKTVVGVVEAFRDCARRNAQEWSTIFKKRPDLRENWEEAAALSEIKLSIARQEIVDAAKGDVEGAYDTIARALFKYPQEASFKRFFWSVFGDMAAEVIKSNLKKNFVAA